MEKIFDLIEEETRRQEDTIELIASENIVSKDVLRAQGSILTNKYAEGYPGKRYYGGCEVVDKIEQEAIDLACQLFKCNFANVQPHSGTHANQIAYASMLDLGDTILSMRLDCGGHLTHGSPASSVSKLYNIISYGLDKDEVIDFNEVRKLALEYKPKLILCGASAYSREIDFKKFREIADEVGAFLMADIAHIAGLVATDEHPSPFPYCDIVTTTTHKTLRGPRGGLILTNDSEIAKKVNFCNFPQNTGGPLLHIIAAKAVAFHEALQHEFKEYIKQVKRNAVAMANTFKSRGVRVISGGTDNHLMLLDLTSLGVTGKEAQEKLDKFGITLNKNSIPNEPLSPFITSGVRIGTPAITTRGFKEEDCIRVANTIVDILTNQPVASLKYLTVKYPIN